MANFSLNFWEEAPLLDGFLGDKHSCNHAINPVLLEKKSDLHTPPFMVISRVIRQTNRLTCRKTIKVVGNLQDTSISFQ